MPGSITSANAVYMLAVLDLFPVPQQLQEFAADDVFGTDPIDSAEVMMGVDGSLAGGFVFQPIKQGISLQANSRSIPIFDAWWQAQQVATDIFEATGVISLPSLGQSWSLTRGFLTSYPPIPDAKRVLQPRRFGITWNKVVPIPI